MIALIDMDLVLFRSAISAENDGFGIAKYRAEQLLEGLMKKTDAIDFRGFISSKTNFRKTVMPSYKANRTAPKPIHLKDLQEYALKHMDAEMSRDDLEADDELAIHQDENTVIVTLDKDLLQVPGKHFSWEISGKNWKRPDKWVNQTELEGMRLFFVQCIMGDTTDNIPGVKNYGKVKATKLLGGCSTEQEMFDVVRQLYSNDEDFISNASCVWMRRSIDDVWRDRFDKFQESVGKECLEDTQETLEPS
jgi:DNA polymerase-1